jgi:VanZ family protein
MPTSAQLQTFERRLVIMIFGAMFLVILAAFAGVLLTHGNTLAIVDPVVRWLRPSVSPTDILRIHDMARKFGHFLIPAVAFALLVIGPLRRRPLIALALCALFASIDEFLQTFIPGRHGSALDVILDTSGALFAYFVYRAIIILAQLRRIPPSAHRERARR